MTTSASGRRAAVTTPGDREIVIERLLAAPRQAVWDLWIDPDRIHLWWGPREQQIVVEAMDVRPGGAWRYVTSGPYGVVHAFSGTFLEVREPDRIVWTFKYEGAPGVATETITFEERGDETFIRTHSIYDTPEGRDAMAVSGMERGVNQMFERAEELLADAAAS